MIWPGVRLGDGRQDTNNRIFARGAPNLKV